MRVFSRLAGAVGVALGTAVLAAGVVLLGLVAPTVASATVHTGHVVFDEPQNPPHIGSPQPPAVQTREYEREILVSYDASAGTLTVEVEVWDAAYWGERLPGRGEGEAPLRFWIGPHCGESSPEQLANHPGLLEGSIEAAPYHPANPEFFNSRPEGGVSGAVALAGYTGSVDGTGSFNGQRFHIVFASPVLQNQNWRCVSLANEGGLSFELGGYPTPPAVVGHRASAALIRTLTATANAHHTDGFNMRQQYLTNGRVTNNGWADAEQRFRRPSNPVQRQRSVFIVFHVLGGRWRVVTFGSSASTGLCHPGKHPAVPAAVCRALRL